jgi:hypothetical protein
MPRQSYYMAKRRREGALELEVEVEVFAVCPEPQTL